MKGRAIRYTDPELDWIRANCTRDRREAHAEFQARFGRDDVSLDNFNALCKRRGWLTGRDGRFHAGQVSHNKGRKGWCAPGCERTWFRKGNRTGRANNVYKPIGTERLTKEGYLERKVNDDMPLRGRWRAVHLINWEARHGPVPSGHALKCRDGNRQNTDPDNWELIPRALLPRLSGAQKGRMNYDQAPPELRPALLATARLEHAVREARKDG